MGWDGGEESFRSVLGTIIRGFCCSDKGSVCGGVVVLFDIKPDAAGRWCCLCLFLVLLGIPRSASASLATSSEVIITGFRGRGGGGGDRAVWERQERLGTRTISIVFTERI